MSRILAVGANAAWQKTLQFKDFKYGEVNRAVEMHAFASGKGINFVRAAGVYGRAEAVLVQFSGGENGRYICEYLQNEGMEFINIPTSGATRCCITCLNQSDRSMTELIEPSTAVSPAERRAMLTAIEQILADVDGAAICGSLPDGTPPEFYIQLAEKITAAGKMVLLDAYKNIMPVLNMPGVMLKINREELAKLTGIDGIQAGLQELFSKTGLKYAAITDGAGCAFMSDGEKLFSYQLPELPLVVNPIGCGDTASGTWLSGIADGMNPAEAFRNALGCASANAESLLPGSFDPARAAELAAAVAVKESAL